ncbi:hypothetical protein Tco_1577585 [Tanacetum coccineum]
MADLTFADSHNMVVYLEKSEANTDFAEIVNFLNASPIRYALNVSPTIYVSYIEQFWSTAKTKTVNNETQIRAKVDGKTIVITESSVRRDLHFDDEDDEAVHEERGDSVERVAATAASLDAKQDSGGSPRSIASIKKSLLSLWKMKVVLKKVVSVVEDKDSIVDPVTTAGETVTTTSVNPEDSTAIDVSVGSPTRLVNDSTIDDVTLAETLMAIRSIASNHKRFRKDYSIEVRIDVDAQLIERLQAKEREQMFVEEQARLLMEFNSNSAIRNSVAGGGGRELRGKSNKPGRGGRESRCFSYIYCVVDIVEDDAKKAELKACLEIVLDDDSAADGSTKYYKVFSAMLNDFDRQDVLDQYRLVKERFETTSPEGYNRLLWGDLITLFEPSTEDEI